MLWIPLEAKKDDRKRREWETREGASPRCPGLLAGCGHSGKEQPQSGFRLFEQTDATCWCSELTRSLQETRRESDLPWRTNRFRRSFGCGRLQASGFAACTRPHQGPAEQGDRRQALLGPQAGGHKYRTVLYGTSVRTVLRSKVLYLFLSLPLQSLQDLEEQKRTKFKINGTATTAIEKSNPNLPAKSRLPYSYQEHEQGGQQRQPRDSHQLPQIESVT